jgi:uncharacterized protein YdaU (DUF1376 family)
VNFYEHHIGDYAEATAHLTFVEDAAYSRLIRKYYSTEKPLPVDVKAVQRLVGARSKDEREAVEAILNEFFDLREDGWHNDRCDIEIKNYLDGEPEREAKRANEKARLKNHRDERSRLFNQLNDAGLHTAWNTPIKELRDMVSKIKKPLQEPGPKTPETKPATPLPPLQESAPETPATTPATPLPPLQESAPETPATANQIPLPTSQYPVNSSNNTHTTPEVISEPSMQGLVCVELQRMGVMRVNPHHVDLKFLLDEGAVMEDFKSAGQTAIQKGCDFSYVIGILKKMLERGELQTQKSQSNPSRLSPGSTKNNNSRGNYDRKQHEKQSDAHSLFAEKYAHFIEA